jgi:hypothetical protein
MQQTYLAAIARVGVWLFTLLVMTISIATASSDSTSVAIAKYYPVLPFLLVSNASVSGTAPCQTYSYRMAYYNVSCPTGLQPVAVVSLTNAQSNVYGNYGSFACTVSCYSIPGGCLPGSGMNSYLTLLTYNPYANCTGSPATFTFNVNIYCVSNSINTPIGATNYPYANNSAELISTTSGNKPPWTIPTACLTGYIP